MSDTTDFEGTPVGPPKHRLRKRFGLVREINLFSQRKITRWYATESARDDAARHGMFYGLPAPVVAKIER